jgi:acetyl esterase/lipase
LPPLAVYVGGDEVLLGDALNLADRCRQAGAKCEVNVWPGQQHVWQLFAPLIPEADESLRHAATFVTAHLRDTQKSA